jgi:uncharacterized protein (TIGR02757 family)
MTSPSSYLKNVTRKILEKDYTGFKHRFIKENDLVSMMLGIKDVILRYGSLGACFDSCMKEEDSTIFPALSKFVGELKAVSNDNGNRLLPSPSNKSACKRLNLYLRWMVREDRVDPGGWVNIPTKKLIIPLDTHMHKIGLILGFTKRKQNDLKTALEITNAFRKFSPDDPVKYDFALTRLGIREKMDKEEILKKILSTGSLFSNDKYVSNKILKNSVNILM